MQKLHVKLLNYFQWSIQDIYIDKNGMMKSAYVFNC